MANLVIYQNNWADVLDWIYDNSGYSYFGEDCQYLVTNVSGFFIGYDDDETPWLCLEGVNEAGTYSAQMSNGGTYGPEVAIFLGPRPPRPTS